MSKFAEVLAPVAAQMAERQAEQNRRNAAWQAHERAIKEARNKEPKRYSAVKA